MQPTLSVVAIDLAKNLFHLVGMDARGQILGVSLSESREQKPKR